MANDGSVDPWNSSYVPDSGDVGAGTRASRSGPWTSPTGSVFASWGESVNKTVIYNQATAAFIARWVSDGDTQAVLASGGNVYVGGHWFRYMGPNVNSTAVYFAAFDAASLAKETVVAPIPSDTPWASSPSSPTAAADCGWAATSEGSGVRRPSRSGASCT